MKANKPKYSTGWITFIVVWMVIALGALIFGSIYWYGQQNEGVNEGWSTIIRNLGLGAAGFLGLPFLIWQTFQRDRTSKAQDRQAQTAAESQITERFGKAIEQLGHSEQAVRIGAIYTLNQIAQEQPETYFWPIMDTLADFIREKTKDAKVAEYEKEYKSGTVKAAIDEQALDEGMQSQVTESSSVSSLDNEQAWLEKNATPADAVTALRVMGACEVLPDRPKAESNHGKPGFRLQKIKLINVDLSGLKFENTSFKETILIKCIFNSKCHFEHSEFDKSKIYACEFREAVFKETSFYSSQLHDLECSEAKFISSDLTEVEAFDLKAFEADFTNAILSGSDFKKSDFEQATFNETDLKGTRLHVCDFNNSKLQNAILGTDETSKRPTYFDAQCKLDSLDNEAKEKIEPYKQKLKKESQPDLNKNESKKGLEIEHELELTPKSKQEKGQNSQGLLETDFRERFKRGDINVEKLAGADLSFQDLSELDLRGANLVEANLEEAILFGAYLQRANLRGTNLIGTNLERAILFGANLERANLRWADLEGAKLGGANLAGANCFGANCFGANLNRAKLVEANLERANLKEANLERANLSGANLESANLESANLESANLAGANLVQAKLSGANLAGAYLLGANLERANLNRAKLAGAYLSGADLGGAKLAGANLERANLLGAKLAGADLFGAKLVEANLAKAMVERTDWFEYLDQQKEPPLGLKELQQKYWIDPEKPQKDEAGNTFYSIEVRPGYNRG